MLTVLRQSRILSIVLLLLGPGISGNAVQWLHACPTASQRGAEHQHHGSGQPGSGQLPMCQCIGTCRTGTILTPSSPAKVLAVVAQPARRSILPPDASFVPLGTHFDLLPPATAPPLS